MCSVSWLLEDKGYQVFFNRDEQKSRALALPPTQLNINGVEVLMPIDPTGSGSWISMNQFGLSLCLLNNYQGITPSGTLLSRGLLLKHLSRCKSTAQVTQLFNQLNTNQFSPFTLLVFSPTLSKHQPQVFAYSWDGEHRYIEETDSPLFSSGFDLSNVVKYRKTAYKKLTKTGNSQASLLEFHSHHHPEFSHMSTCMHREDAHTVSFTHLHANDGDFSMYYRAGSPCQSLATQASHTNEQHSHQLNTHELNKNRFTFSLSEVLSA